MLVRAIKGLEDVISYTVVMPIWQRTRPDDPNDVHAGWHFCDPPPHDDENDENGAPNPPLRNAIGLGGPFPSHYGDGNMPDPSVYRARTVRDLYERAAAAAAGGGGGVVRTGKSKYTVPILYDKVNNAIVSNESSDIIRMLNSEFDEYATHPDVDLRPEDMISSMDEVDGWIYHTINNGVYR